MRERGVQSRRVRSVEPERVRRSSSPGGPGGGGFWQGLAIFALIAATAGWTTVAVLAFRPAQVAQATLAPSSVPSDDEATSSDDPLPSDEPIVASHTVPDLEALLPTEVSNSTLVTESWTGDKTLADNPLAPSLTTYLTGIDKTLADLQFAQAYDPTFTGDPTVGIDLSVGVFRVVGADATVLRDSLIKAWRDNSPDLLTTTVTLGGKKVTKGDFGAGQINSYWYVVGPVVFDVETPDEALAIAAITKLPKTVAATPPSGSPASPASAAPSRSPSASPS